MDVREKSSNEKRLIDAYALWRKFESEPWYDNADRDEIALLLVDDAPTVDAVEVVRCKDCKHRYKDSWCEYVDDDDNFYCARGERKGGAD